MTSTNTIEIKEVEFETFDLDFFLVSEVIFKRYVMISRDLPINHKAFIYTCDFEDFESKEALQEALLPEDRIIILQSETFANENIYEIYKHKLNINNKIEELKEDDELRVLKDFKQFEEEMNEQYYSEDEDLEDYSAN